MAKTTTIKTRIFFLLFAIAGVCIFLPSRLTDKLNFALSGITNILTGKPSQLVSEVKSEINDIATASDPASELEQKYLAVLTELNNARSEIEYQKQFIQELANIRSELSLDRASLVRSHITASDSSVSRKCRVIDRGTNDQIRTGYIALASIPRVDQKQWQSDVNSDTVWRSAVAGRIIEVKDNSSVMQMINDPAFSATVLIRPAAVRGQNFATEGILYSDSSGSVRIKHVETSSEVMVGDPVFLMASEKTLPVDVIIGYVAECSYDPDNAVLWNITVRPAIDLSDVKDIVVICRGNGQ